MGGFVAFFLFCFWLLGSIVVGVIATDRGRSGVGFFFLALFCSPLFAAAALIAAVTGVRNEAIDVNTGIGSSSTATTNSPTK